MFPNNNFDQQAHLPQNQNYFMNHQAGIDQDRQRAKLTWILAVTHYIDIDQVTDREAAEWIQTEILGQVKKEHGDRIEWSTND